MSSEAIWNFKRKTDTNMLFCFYTTEKVFYYETICNQIASKFLKIITASNCKNVKVERLK